MKIIAKDNFDREGFVSDLLIAENIHKAYSELIVDFLNSKSSSYSSYIFILVEDDYKLYKFEP